MQNPDAELSKAYIFCVQNAYVLSQLPDTIILNKPQMLIDMKA